MLPKLQTFLDNSRETVIAWQKELTMRAALGPENNGQGEHLRSLWIIDTLKNMGIDNIEVIICPDNRVECGFRPNVIAKIPGKETKTLWLIAHTDTVPVGDSTLWHTPPFEATIEGDYIIGRGVEDNQQGIVTAMLTAQALLKECVTPELSLGLLFVADEETGMDYGLPYVLQQKPDLIKETDLVIIPDTGSNDGSMVEIAEKSCFWLRFTVNGKQCHASMPQLGVNSLVVASACILALDALHQRFPATNTLFIPPYSTFVPSKKEANVENINTIPGRDTFYLDCRVLPDYPLKSILEEAQKVANVVAQQYSARIDVEVIHASSANAATEKDAPVVSLLTKALQKRGVEANLQGSGGQTFAVLLRNQGIPAVAWSTLVPNPHVPNERSSIKATLADAVTVTAILFPSSLATNSHIK